MMEQNTFETLRAVLERLESTKSDESVCFTGKEARILSAYIAHLERSSYDEPMRSEV